MPLGIYIRSVGKIQVGNIVLICLNDPYKTLGLKKSYLEIGHKCNGADPVIKMVIAVPGDHVVLANGYIEVNGIKYLFKTFHWDGMGRKLNVYPRGNYSSTVGYWLIGTHDIKSWDSRYWGPVSKKQILRKIKLLAVW
jgi:conjugative transfer signal peptidase TraF